MPPEPSTAWFGLVARTIEFYVVMAHVTVIGALMIVTWKSGKGPAVAAH